MTRKDALDLLDEHLGCAPIMPDEPAERAEWFVQLIVRAYSLGKRVEHMRAAPLIRSSRYTPPERTYTPAHQGRGRWVGGKYRVGV